MFFVSFFYILRFWSYFCCFGCLVTYFIINFFVNNFEVVQNLNMTFNEVDFIFFAFALSFSDRTLQLRSLFGGYVVSRIF